MASHLTLCKYGISQT